MKRVIPSMSSRLAARPCTMACAFDCASASAAAAAEQKAAAAAEAEAQSNAHAIVQGLAAKRELIDGMTRFICKSTNSYRQDFNINGGPTEVLMALARGKKVDAYKSVERTEWI